MNRVLFLHMCLQSVLYLLHKTIICNCIVNFEVWSWFFLFVIRKYYLIQFNLECSNTVVYARESHFFASPPVSQHLFSSLMFVFLLLRWGVRPVPDPWHNRKWHAEGWRNKQKSMVMGGDNIKAHRTPVCG